MIAPFWAIELQKSTTTRIQKTRDRIASPTDAPGAARTPGPAAAAGRSRMNSATGGDADRQRHAAKRQECAAPAGGSDERRGQRRQHDGAERAARHDERERHAAPSIEPARHGA